MKLDIQWEDLEPFLTIRRKQGRSSVVAHKSRFKILKAYFADRDFSGQNFDRFLFEHQKKGVSASWQNNYLKLAKHIAAYLGIKEEFAEYKYLDDHSGHPENVLTPQQIQQLAEVTIHYARFKNRKEKHRALIYLLGTIGSRIDETLHLLWNDIKQDGKIPMIHFRKEITKTKKERFVPIPHWLLHILLNLPHDNDLIFNLIDASNFRRDLEQRRIKCKIPFHVTPHTFRDSSINNKLEVDIPLQEVTALHGHATTNTTYKYYTRIQASKLAQNLTKLDPAFSSDQTYTSFIEARREDIERSVNTHVCNYVHKEETDEKGHRVVWFGFIEK